MPPNPILPLAPLLLSPVLDEENQAAIQNTEWVSLGLSRSVVALEKNTQDQLIALGMDGSLFRLGSSGRWINLLKKEEDVVNPEDLLLDAESTMSEILEGVSVEESYFDEETEELIIEESQANFEDEIQGGVFDPLREDGVNFDKRPALWSFDDVIVYCIESCRESLNRGRTWSDLRIPRIHEVVEYIIDEKAYLVAATETGIWLRERGARKWELASVSLRNFSFYDLLQKDGALIAASNMGVFRSSNSLFWNRINTRSDIQQFEEVSEGILAVLDDGLALSVDRGETFTALVDKEYTDPLKDLTILGLKSQDENVYLLTNRELYVWDAGLVRIGQNLSGNSFLDVVSWKGSLVVTVGHGVFVRSTKTNADAVTMRLSLKDVLGMVLYDVDKRAEALQIQAPLLSGSLAPTISLTGSLDRNLTLGVDFGGISSNAQENWSWVVGVDVCFGLCGTVGSSSVTALQEEELLVINGSVYSQGGYAAAAAGLSYEIIKERSELSNYTTGLYMTHRRLLMQRAQLNSRSVLERVFHELEIEEVVSRLDVLTSGRYSGF